MQESLQSARLMAYALWATELELVAMNVLGGAGAMPSATPLRPVLERRADSASTLHMPGNAALSVGFPCGAIHAAAAHAAAHVRFGSGHVDDTAIKPLHQAVLGVLEDARVESLAMAELPGLRRLWQGFHDASAADETTLEALLRRLARVLFDPARTDPHPWVQKGRRLYLDARDLGWPELRRAASILANDIGQMRVRFDAAGYQVHPAYRDDNTHLWQLPEGRAIASQQPLDQPESGKASASAAAGGRTEGDATDLRTELRPLGVVPEWDRLISLYRADWCSLVEMRPHESDPAALVFRLKEQATWIAGLARRLRKAASTRRKRIRTSDGGDVDEAALIDSGIALRIGSMPESTIHLGTALAHAPRRIVFILDASVSTAGDAPSWFGIPGARLLDGMAWAAMLACAAFEEAGHDCMMFGFNSNTRHCVRMLPIKNLAEPPSSPAVLARLAGLTPEWSTRSGAALRYATQLAQGAGGAMIVLVSDGHPHDVDMHDPRYLPEDLQRAAQEAARCGVNVLGLEVEPDAAKAHAESKLQGWPCVRVSSLSMIADALVHAVRRRL